MSDARTQLIDTVAPRELELTLSDIEALLLVWDGDEIVRMAGVGAERVLDRAAEQLVGSTLEQALGIASVSRLRADIASGVDRVGVEIAAADGRLTRFIGRVTQGADGLTVLNARAIAGATRDLDIELLQTNNRLVANVRELRRVARERDRAASRLSRVNDSIDQLQAELPRCSACGRIAIGDLSHEKLALFVADLLGPDAQRGPCSECA